jgi:hypothetical protein
MRYYNAGPLRNGKLIRPSGEIVECPGKSIFALYLSKDGVRVSGGRVLSV